MSLYRVLLVSVVVCAASASSDHSPLQKLAELLLQPSREKSVPTLFVMKKSALEGKAHHHKLGDESTEKRYWLEYLLRSQKGSGRQGHDEDETPNDLLQALRQRCQKVDKCAKKCPQKKSKCKKTCKEILDQDNFCEKPKPKPEPELESECDDCEEEEPICDSCEENNNKYRNKRFF